MMSRREKKKKLTIINSDCSVKELCTFVRVAATLPRLVCQRVGLVATAACLKASLFEKSDANITASLALQILQDRLEQWFST